MADSEPEASGGPSPFFLDVRQRGNKFDVGFLTAPTELRGEQKGAGGEQTPATSCYRVHYSKNKKLVFSECRRCADEGGTRTIRVTEYRNVNYGCGQEKSASEGAVWKLSRDGPDWAGYSMDAMTFPHGILIGRTTSNAGEEANPIVPKEADEPEVEAGDWDYSDLLYVFSDDNSVGIRATGEVPVAERAGSSGSGGEQVTSAKNGLLDHREGLFAKRAFNKGELISFYNGVRMTQEVCDARDWKENGNCVTLWKDGPGTVIDVPFPQSSMQNYCATVGHKANHSRTHVNARYGPYEGHPRFGDVVCIRAIRRIARGEEIFCDYGYGLLGASAGAEERGEADGDDGVPDWFTPEL
eukprot:g2249.t1